MCHIMQALRINKKISLIGSFLTDTGPGAETLEIMHWSPLRHLHSNSTVHTMISFRMLWALIYNISFFSMTNAYYIPRQLFSLVLFSMSFCVHVLETGRSRSNEEKYDVAVSNGMCALDHIVGGYNQYSSEVCRTFEARRGRYSTFIGSLDKNGAAMEGLRGKTHYNLIDNLHYPPYAYY